MRKTGRIAGVVGAVAAVAVAALLGARIAFAQTPEPLQGFGPWYRADGHWRGHGGMFGNHETMYSAVADTLGISVDELEAAHAEGKHLSELAEELGVDIEQVHAAMQAARAVAFEDAVANESITQEQVDKMTARHAEMSERIAAGEWPAEHGRGWGRKGPGFGGHSGDCLQESE